MTINAHFVAAFAFGRAVEVGTGGTLFDVDEEEFGFGTALMGAAVFAETAVLHCLLFG